MTYSDLLRESAKKFGNIICLGIDPVLERIPIKGSPGEVILEFYLSILQTCKDKNVYPSIVKPNAAFFEQYGLEGISTLHKIIQAYKDAGMLVILDAKRGDIGKTSKAYAKACFEAMNANATTIAPYMGFDSVHPFIEYSKDTGIYILNRTSNKGARDFQDLLVDGTPLYHKIAQKIIEWSNNSVGAVIGATYPEELKTLATLFAQSGKDIPLLIPGVGSQGGSGKEVVQILKNTGYDLNLVRINSSSGINYAYEKKGTDNYAKAAVEALKELIEETTF